MSATAGREAGASVPPVRVVVVDADPRVRAGLVGLLELSSQVVVVGEAGHLAAARETCRSAQPDLILIDPRLPDVDAGLALVEALRGTCPGGSIVVLSWADELAPEAIARGAAGFVAKSATPDELIGRILALAGRSEVRAVVDSAPAVAGRPEGGRRRVRTARSERAGR
ncbi:MAG TPA: response regulator transcription factor [Candidatus Limnocylindrales bacterium]|nr:response regulator transcription factor [Candidatus Limnocylindrales bacterium]